MQGRPLSSESRRKFESLVAYSPARLYYMRGVRSRMSSNEKPLSSAFMVWKHLRPGSPFRTRVSGRQSYLSNASWSAEIVFSPGKIRALKEEAASLFRDLPDTLQPDFFLASLARYRRPCV